MELNRQGLTSDRFSYQLRLSRLWSGLSLHHSRFALGAARQVSTPSRFKGLARDCTLLPRQFINGWKWMDKWIIHVYYNWMEMDV